MKFNILLLFIIFNSFQVNAQNTLLDSITLKWKYAKSDTAKLKTMDSLLDSIQNEQTYLSICDSMYKISNFLINNTTYELYIFGVKYQAITDESLGVHFHRKGEITKALNYTQSSLDLRNSIKDSIGISSSLINLGLIYSETGRLKEAEEIFITSSSYLDEIKDANQLSTIYNNLGRVYSDLNDYEKAMSFYNKCLNIRTSQNNQKGIANVLNNIGVLEFERGNISKSIEYQEKSLAIKRNINNPRELAVAEINLGAAFKEKGLLVNSINYYLDALKISEANNYADLSGSIYNNMGAIYSLQKEYLKAIEYYQSALSIFEVISNKRGVGSVWYSLGITYSKCNQLDDALNAFNESLKIRTLLKDKQGISRCLNSIGNIYFKKENYSLALQNTLSAIDIQRAISDKKGLVSSLSSLGRLYEAKDSLLLAQMYLEEGLDSAKSIGLPQEIYMLSKNLSRIYKKTNNYEALAESYKTMMIMNDSLQNDSIKREILKSQLAYEFDKKELIYKLDKEKKEKDNLALQFQNEKQAQRNLLLYSQNELANLNYAHEKDLRSLSDNLAKQRLDSIGFLEEQKQNLSLIAKQEKEIQKVASDLQIKKIHSKNIFIFSIAGLAILIGIIGYLLYLNRKRKFQKNLTETEEKALRAQLKPHFVFNALATIQKQVRDNPSMAESYLIKFSHFTQEVLVNSEKQRIPLSDELDMLTNYIELQNLRLQHPINHQYQFSPEIDPEEVMVPPAIFQPLVENSVNHNFALKDGKGNLTLTFKKEKDILVCQLIDSCSGLKKSISIKQDKLHERKSFGQQIVRERLDLWSKGKGRKGFLELIPQSEGMLVTIGIPL